MAMLACPFCYQRMNSRAPWFRCIGRGSPGHEPCKPQFDAARVRELNNPELVLPSFPSVGRNLRVPSSAVCPHCLGETGVKVCPTCHTKLPPGFGEGESPLIAVIGAKGTGKSVYLKVLAFRLRRELGNRFGADIRLVGDSQFDSGHQDFLNPGGDLFPDRQLYPKTAAAADGRREPIVFAMRQRRRRLAVSRFDTTYLSFYDTSGEDLETESTVENLRYLGAADGLVLLLDPLTIPRARDQVDVPLQAVTTASNAIDVLGRVTDNLRITHRINSRRNIPVPVAVAFAKIDAFFGVLGQNHPLARWPQPQPFYDEPAGRTIHEHVRSLLFDWRADDLDAHLNMHYRTFRYFAVSALGAEPDYARSRVDEAGVHPFRVEEPLLWLLSRFGVVPSGGGTP